MKAIAAETVKRRTSFQFEVYSSDFTLLAFSIRSREKAACGSSFRSGRSIGRNIGRVIYPAADEQYRGTAETGPMP